MGIAPNCCEKDENLDNIIKERNEIFNLSPEDNKIPDDASFISNQGGEYPVETEKPAEYVYEAKYPKLVSNEKIIIQNLPQEKIYEYDTDGNNTLEYQFMEEQNRNDMNNLQKGEMMRLKQLFDLCYRNGKPRPCDDFDPTRYTMFYPKEDPYFYVDRSQSTPNSLKIYNQNDMNNLQIYQGDLNASGQRHGLGKCTTPYYVLMGTWKNDQFSGWGRESRINGDVFEGRYENGVLNGKGIFLNEKKCKYVGDFVNTKRHGHGQLSTDKILYEGDFVNNKLEGNGKILFLRDGAEYTGTFKNDQIDGYGQYKWRNGDSYEGHVKNGKINGWGTYKYKNGKKVYEYFNKGEKESEKMRKYEIWKKSGYGNPNYKSYLQKSNHDEEEEEDGNDLQENNRPESESKE